MKKLKTLLIPILIFVLALGSNLLLISALDAAPRETNAFAGDYYVPPINQDKPFFDEVLPKIEENIKEYNKHSVTPYFDKLPELDNEENFQGLGSTTYANINGKTVTAEAFYRIPTDSDCDPNNGMGLLLYQCIQYKRAHPDEDVKITFSSYRTSVTASVCVIPESKYYGYMRSLFTTNYDEQGFVRISYMLLEAARMGIEVTAVNHLDSYAVSQYNPATGKTKGKSILKLSRYLEEAKQGPCYDKYAKGKNVSDFYNAIIVDWKVLEKTADMQHIKSATVSHYLATDGTEHGPTVYFGSSNLDDNTHLGRNGNGSAQSGVIVSDHDELYRVAYNYMQLMTRYKHENGIYELRDYVNKANEEQIALIKAGREDEIPKDEQIVYLGSETDPVFELYFTPFGGSADAWDTEHNPFCKYIDKLPQSTDYVELIWNEFGYGNCQIGDVFSNMLAEAYCNNPNPKNKLSIRVTGFNTDEIANLKVGTEIGACSIKDGTGIHSKDINMSYAENGVRHRVSLLTSCNFYMIAFNYRTNSLLVINETDESGGDFYYIMNKKYSYGMITKE